MLSWLQHRWTGFYLLLLGLGALSLFLYGFFPLKYHTGQMSHYDDLPNFIEGVSIDGHEVYNPGETSVILLVIDGLRYDFVTEEYMPFTGQLLKNKSACIYVSVAEPPTVTMPRIKAMMTGSVSTFADVALNFGAPAVRGDSVLRVAATRGRHSVLYGDDTWLRLFPGLWSEADGTTSFYVTDYTEVDNNVTRHLNKVLTPDDKNQPKFDFLVLHYLGLDHIGHLEGARSPKIKPKLIEMDEIVKKIYKYMQTWDRTGVLLVCGDHGMRDAGGHGGATAAEILVPLVVAKTNDYKCPYELGRGPTVAQVDLAPTISWLLNAPIPGDSTGKLLPSLLPHQYTQHLYLLHYVAKHNAKAVEAQLGSGAVDKEFYKQFVRAQKQFAQYLATKQVSAAKIAKEFYEESLEAMAKYLAESTVNFDMFAITVAIIILYLLTAALICLTLYSLQTNIKQINIPHHKRSKAGAVVAFLILFALLAFTLVLSCAITETKSNLCSLNPQWIPATILIPFTLTIIYFITKSSIQQNLDLSFLKELNAIDYLLIFGTLLHPLTFFGTSFIEEEHMTWYFYWNTLMFFVLMRTLVVVVMYFSKLFQMATEVQDKPQLGIKMVTGISILPKWVLLIALHRYLRTMNQTGDRWLFLPDTADWLNAPENRFYLQLHLVTGTLLTFAICVWNLRYTNNLFQMNTAFTILSTLCIISYRIATDALDFGNFGNIKSWDTVHIVNVFWGLLIGQMVFEILSYVGVFRKCVNNTNPSTLKTNDQFIYNKPKEKTEDFVFEETEPWNSDEVKLNLVRSISHIVFNHMMLIIILLMRPHNVIMVPSVYFTCLLTTKCLDHQLLKIAPRSKTDGVDVLGLTLVHLWIGQIFFFYQGNSNSLASVDLGAGYVGLSSYSEWRVAVRMGLHSHAGPALSGVMLFVRMAKHADKWDRYLHSVWQTTNILSLQRVYSVCIYCLVSAIFRHHLFVWSVFSPKLLYDFVGTVFSVQALLTILEIVWLTRFTSWLAKTLTYRKL